MAAIFLIAALICFIAAAIGARTNINLVACGLACATASVLLG